MFEARIRKENEKESLLEKIKSAQCIPMYNGTTMGRCAGNSAHAGSIHIILIIGWSLRFFIVARILKLS